MSNTTKQHNDVKYTNKKTHIYNKETALFIRGLIIGKVLTILVVGGLFWWLLRPRLSTPSSANSSSAQGSDNASVAASTFETVADIPIGTFNYGGSTAWSPIRLLVDSQLQSTHPELQLRYVDPANGSPGSSSAIHMLLDGQLDFVQSSRPLKAEEYSIARRRGFKLEQHLVGIDGVAVVVNRSLQMTGLTVNQLRQIYQGQITNWSQLGGPDLQITPFSLRPEGGDTIMFSEQGGSSSPKQPLGSNVQYIYSTTEALRQVSSTPGGVYYASASAVVPQCSVKPLPLGRTANQLVLPYREPLIPTEQCPRQRNQVNAKALKNGSYPVVRKLFVITKQNQYQQQQAGAAYAKLLLTDQGQKAIKQVGFMGVR